MESKKHKFVEGQDAILDITFELVEQGGDYTFDDTADIVRFVRGDMVRILHVFESNNEQKHKELAVVFNPKTQEATTISTHHLKPVKGQTFLNIEVTCPSLEEAIEKCKKIIEEAVKNTQCRPYRGSLGSDDMKIKGGMICVDQFGADPIYVKKPGGHIHTDGIIHAKKVSF
ncbi:hypothetical protein COM97_27075 [Bacillus thuringiensis]|uniref:hypothetical protein n=1 Tax=Bacillus thuringiensis TaxID=1428 RepID=UPI000BEB680B|nr:hypothetical protein [Bacillus thuringiensis]PEF03406.1 hypothetical protein COM97_27075 [Bacillus thuringiensis]